MQLFLFLLTLDLRCVQRSLVRLEGGYHDAKPRELEQETRKPRDDFLFLHVARELEKIETKYCTRKGMGFKKAS